jgi:lipopolysaccharide biosynthesis regulator YciM
LARNYPRAMQAYRTVRTRFSRTPEAQRAAFTMGRIEFEAHGKYTAAVHWFKTCIADNAGGTMTREASGRLMEALQRSGDRRGAQSAARKYLTAYQNGPHAGLAKQILSNTSESL